MPMYEVRIPLVGVAIVVKSAESEQEAIEKSLHDFEFMGTYDLVENGCVECLEPIERVVEGNVFHGPLNRAQAEEIKEEEEECEQS